MKNTMFNQRGFTLIELLVVVLIIGILSSVALPQYTKAVEKSRMTEALTMMRSLQQATDVYLLESGKPSSMIRLLGGSGNSGDMLTIDVSSLSCTDDNHGNHFMCYSKNFGYEVTCESSGCIIYAQRLQGNTPFYTLFFDNRGLAIGRYNKWCMIETNEGEAICKYLSSQGWEYDDDR